MAKQTEHEYLDYIAKYLRSKGWLVVEDPNALVERIARFLCRHRNVAIRDTALACDGCRARAGLLLRVGLEEEREMSQSVQEELRARAEEIILREPMFSSREAADVLGPKPVGRTRLATMYEQSWIVELPSNQGPLYPRFQFNQQLHDVYPEVREVNNVLMANKDPWGVASWWVTPNGRFGGVRPVDLVGTARSADLSKVARGLLEPIG